tara:strand:- start:2732 stop:3976 length:1245 start_codon:yes stop_codon:yes gene_type:complete
MKWFCPLPFYHIYSNSNGKWAACCLSKSPGHTTENTSLMEWYNSEHMNNLRDEMIGLSNSSENINAFCKICVNQEMNEGSSTRLKWISNLKSDRKKGVDKTVEEYVNTNKISFKDNNYRFLELKLRIFGNLCNLSCFMCWPQNSSSRMNDVNKMANPIWKKMLVDPSMSKFFSKGKSLMKEQPADKFRTTIDEIRSFSKNIESVKITGGEPLMLDSHYELLDMFIETGDAKDIRLKYQTNLTKFDRGKNNFISYLHQFRSTHISASIDSYSIYDEYLRKGTDSKLVANNLKVVENLDKVTVHIASTVTNLSVLRLKEFYKRYKNYKIESFILTTPEFLNIKHLPDKIKKFLIEDLKDTPNLYEYDKIKNMLSEPRDEDKFQLSLKYLIDTDTLYGRKKGVFDLWPELKQYWRHT